MINPMRLKTVFIGAVLLGFSTILPAQGGNPVPTTEFVFEIRAELAPTEVLGDTKDGMRQVIPITGGTVTGPGFTAEIVPGGADYQLVRPDGVRELEAVYMIRTDDGALINVVNDGIIVDPQVNNGEAYIMTTPRFTAPLGKYDWLNKTVFVSRITGGSDSPRAVHISVYRVR
jgi:hypothetical protein